MYIVSIFVFVMLWIQSRPYRKMMNAIAEQLPGMLDEMSSKSDNYLTCILNESEDAFKILEDYYENGCPPLERYFTKENKTSTWVKSEKLGYRRQAVLGLCREWAEVYKYTNALYFAEKGSLLAGKEYVLNSKAFQKVSDVNPEMAKQITSAYDCLNKDISDKAADSAEKEL